MASLPENAGAEMDSMVLTNDLLTQFHRTLAETSPGQMQADLQTILAASMSMAPLAGLQGLDQLTPELDASTADAYPGPGISLVPGPSLDSEQPSEGHPEMQQENGMGEADSPGSKRKGPPLTEEERRIRRKEINRESARRIRRRKNNEMETLKQQVFQLTNQVQLLIRFAAHVTRENRELAQRLQQAAAAHGGQQLYGGQHMPEQMAGAQIDVSGAGEHAGVAPTQHYGVGVLQH